ncbi:MYXO-CTERM sorting domain-containing protein [Labilithrix luteola]|uniref:MYXO-CTERM sorting domain-containing protein n=1 Tax=Labilithrix luteola TaxID=1391654 RepID=UPI00147679F2|nr:MYXO-CTERM sorting domain-containing protein [Labilithrix luteola]
MDVSTPFPYRAHTFKNRSTSAACVGVVVFSQNDVGPHGRVPPHHSTAYLGSFEPTDVQKNYLGDDGHGGGTYSTPLPYSFMVPPLADFVVVVSSDWSIPQMLDPTRFGYRPFDSAVHYLLYVGGCGELVATGPTPASGPTSGETSITVKGPGFEGTSPANVTSGEPNADRGSAAITAAASERDSTDGAPVSSSAAAGCEVTNGTSTSMTPFVLTLGALATLRRRRSVQAQIQK